MPFKPAEICRGTLGYGTVSEMVAAGACRVRLLYCNNTFDEEVLVPTTPEVLPELRVGGSVRVYFWDGEPVRIERSWQRWDRWERIEVERERAERAERERR